MYFLVFLVVLVQSDTHYHRHIVQMIQDTQAADAIAMPILARLCWPPADILNVYNSLRQPITILNQKQTQLQSSNQLFAVDLDCEQSMEWIAHLEARLFGHPNRWMMITANKSTTALHNLPIWLDSQLTVATWNSSAFNLVEVYNLPGDGGMPETISGTIGTWHPLGLPRFSDMRASEILTRRRQNLRLSPLPATFVLTNNDSANHLEDNIDPHIDTVTKTNFMIIRAMMDALNCTPHFHFSHTWGVRQPGIPIRFTGMMGDLMQGTSVLAGSTIFLTSDRVALFEYISMINPTLIMFVFRAPPLTMVRNIYSLPFEGTVWLSAIGLVMAACIIVAITLRWSAATEEAATVRGSDFALLGVGALAQMGTTVPAGRLSTKLAMIALFIFVLFMFIAYTANIVALLQATTKGIRSLDDLYRSQLDFGVDDTPYNRNWLPNTVGRTQQTLYRDRIDGRPERWMNVSVGVARMREGMFAFHTELGPTFREIEATFYEHEKCGLVLIDFMGMTAPWVGMPKRSPYKELIKVNLFKIREHGIQSRVISRMYKKKPLCTDGGQTFQPVRFVDCHILVQFLGTGFAVALVVLVLELVLHRGWPLLGQSICVN